MEEEIKEYKKKGKICFFSPASYPFFDPNSDVAHGGAELQMFLLANYISKIKKFDVCFLVGNYGQEKSKTLDNIRLIKTITYKQNDNILFKFFKGLKYFYQLIKLKPDVLICTNANSVVGINAFYSNIFNKKFIYRTSHLIDVNKEYIITNGISGKLYKYGLKNADSVITQNKEHKNLLKTNHRIDASLIRNAFIVDQISSESEKRLKEHILWVGRFQKWKRPELFLKIAEKFPNKHFLMICPYTSENKLAWEKLKSKANNISNLDFIEKILFSQIQTYFNKAEVFVNTSDYEGFPNTFLQAALGKTPIISLNVNPDNFITDYNCGIYANGNLEQLYADTSKLINNREERKIMGENLFQYLEKKHDIQKIGLKFKELIDTVL